MAQPKRVSRHKEEEVEEEVEVEVEGKGAVEVYRGMLEMVEEMYKASLPLENDEKLAELLSAIEKVKLSIKEIIEKLEMEMQMAKDVREYEEREKEVENG